MNMSAETLTLSQWKEYIKNIIDLEISCYQQEKLVQEIKSKPATIKKNILELEQQLKNEKEPVKPLGTIGNFIANIIGTFFIPLVGALIGVVCAFIVRFIGGIVGFFHNISIQSSGFLDFIWNFFTSNVDSGLPSWKTFIFWGAIIGYIVCFIIMLIGVVCGKDENKEEQKAYPQKLDAFHNRQASRKKLIERKRESLKTTIPQKILECENNYRKTKKLLQDYYDLGFIYPKYRSLVPMCTIYEYLESGRCFSLLGHEGAYNLYESELRMNTIIGKLDDIIYRLDEISANQRLLAREIKRSNEQLDRIYGTLNDIEHNTALTRYYSSVTASNTTYMSWLAAFSYDENKRIQSKNSI